MSIEIPQVHHIARLARLAISESEARTYATELSRILDLVEHMRQRDTDGVTPMANPLDAHQRLRPDAVTEGDMRAELQAGAPACEDGLYLVPKVLD